MPHLINSTSHATEFTARSLLICVDVLVAVYCSSRTVNIAVTPGERHVKHLPRTVHYTCPTLYTTPAPPCTLHLPYPVYYTCPTLYTTPAPPRTLHLPHPYTTPTPPNILTDVG